MTKQMQISQEKVIDPRGHFKRPWVLFSAISLWTPDMPIPLHRGSFVSQKPCHPAFGSPIVGTWDVLPAIRCAQRN
jgi:hypothetical protein